MAGGSGTVFSTFGAKVHKGGRSTGGAYTPGTKVRRYQSTKVPQVIVLALQLNRADPYQDTHARTHTRTRTRTLHTHTTQSILPAFECACQRRIKSSDLHRSRYTKFGYGLGKGREGRERDEKEREREREGEKGGKVGGGRITIRQFPNFGVAARCRFSTRFRPQCRHDWASDQLLILTLYV